MMRLRFVAGLLLTMLWLAASPALAQAGKEPYRPQFHFTPERGWMNDPNGMVYYAGAWHLFYQFNPFGDKWGHMSWAHAVSRDLVHWRPLPLALAEADSVMIFSGSAVVDWKNTSGLGRNGQPPLVAIYTGHRPPIQDQRIAFSNDSGRTWTKVPDAVLDLRMADFRDPRVFWHEASHSWVMAVALPNEHQVSFYRSPDLKQWTHASDFGPIGATGGQWECPDVFPLGIDGADSTWVMLVNINPGGVAGGSATQYFTGSFDGYRFAADSDSRVTRWADYGPDYYAAVTWNDVPQSDGRRVLIAWMSNWLYGQDVPTSPWRSAMNIPRVLSLRRTPDGLRLVQTPVRELDALRDGAPRTFSGGGVESASRWLKRQGQLPPLLDVEMRFTKVTGRVVVDFNTGPNERTRVVVDGARSRLIVDRTHSGQTAFNDKFAATHEAPLRITSDSVTLRLLIDASSIEVLAQDGETSMTSLIFPTGPARRLRLLSPGGGTRVSSITIRPLHSALP